MLWRVILGAMMLAGCSASSSADTMNGAGTGTGTGDDGSDTESASACAPEIASIQQEIFVPRCLGTGCHEAHSPAAALDLQSEAVATRLVGVAAAICQGIHVVPGDPDGSLLVAKITDAQICGVAMPPDAPLGEPEVACVRAWIEALESTCETCGGDVCIDLETEPAHCGACGQACPPMAACVDGQCVCPDALEACDSSCVNTQTHPDHCGGCNVVCGTEQVCNGGTCSEGCDAPLYACDGGCVDLDTDPQHCGACNAPCGMAETCNAGTCGCVAEPKSYAADIEPIFLADCINMGCHRPPNASENLDLSAGNGYAELVNVPAEQCAQRLLVSPGDPDASYLLDKLRNQNLCAGSQMPKDAPLPAADIQAVADWICSGAMP